VYRLENTLLHWGSWRRDGKKGNEEKLKKCERSRENSTSKGYVLPVQKE
jgi:hypothetical protein